jgi:heme-degrading monooxygenase HmoA
MSEFLDFLKHKYAYVALGEFKPGKLAEAEQMFETIVSTYRQGFKGSYFLQEPGTDRGIAVIFWENIEDMDANKSEFSEEILHQMKHLFAKPPQTSFYEVHSEIIPQDTMENEEVAS